MGQRRGSLIVLALVLASLAYWLSSGEAQAPPISVRPEADAPVIKPKPSGVKMNSPAAVLESRTATTDEATLDSASKTERDAVLAGIGQLAERVSEYKLDRDRWIQAARAISASLEGPVELLLGEQFESKRLNRFESIAAAELIRLERSGKPMGSASLLPPVALEQLRNEMLEMTTGASRLAASRVLAGVGDLADALQLADDLIWSEDVLIQRESAWCLEANERHGVARYLATNVAYTDFDQRTVRLFGTLVAMQAQSDLPLLDAQSKALLTQFVQAFEGRGTDAHGKACFAYLAELDPHGAGTLMFGEIDSSKDVDRVRESSQLIAQADNPESLDRLKQRFFTETDPARRTALAEGLLTATDTSILSPDVQDEALQLVSTLAQTSEHSAVRRRAVAALGTTPTRNSVDALMRVLNGDEDPRVRGAAVHALARFDSSLFAHRRSELGAIEDPSAIVQRSLEFCLSR
ncbi:MAG: hypothetical protein ACI8TQ_003752 [Planctomycetota bacterium]|jgi:hypothetical protein